MIWLLKLILIIIATRHWSRVLHLLAHQTLLAWHNYVFPFYRRNRDMVYEEMIQEPHPVNVSDKFQIKVA